MKRVICSDTALTRNKIKSFLAEGWFLTGHAFLPGIGTGQPQRDNARKVHTYTFEKSN